MSLMSSSLASNVCRAFSKCMRLQMASLVWTVRNIWILDYTCFDPLSAHFCSIKSLIFGIAIAFCGPKLRVTESHKSVHPSMSELWKSSFDAKEDVQLESGNVRHKAPL